MALFEARLDTVWREVFPLGIALESDEFHIINKGASGVDPPIGVPKVTSLWGKLADDIGLPIPIGSV